MDEVWKDVLGYEGHYQVSSLGRIKSLKHKSEKILMPVIDHWGYPVVSLILKRKLKRGKIHRLVMQAFHGESKLQVNHINGIKADNRLQNLEYCSAGDNTRHAHAIGLINEKTWEKWRKTRALNKSGLKPVICLNNGKRYESQKQAGEDLGIEPKRISDILKGRRRIHKGYTFIRGV